MSTIELILSLLIFLFVSGLIALVVLVYWDG